MKKTYFIDLIKTIKVTKISFVSVVVFVTLGVGIFLGFSWTEVGFNKSTNDFIEKYNLHDVDVFFPYGLSEEDVDTVRELECVKEAEGRYSAYNFFTIDGDNYQAKISQITQSVDKLCLIEGRLPNALGEIAINESFSKSHNLKIGDHIRFNSDRNSGDIAPSKIMGFDAYRDDVVEFFDEDVDVDNLDPSEKMVYLNTDEYVITALILSPEYSCTDPVVYGTAPTNGIGIDAGFFVDKASFKEEAFLGYPEIVVLGDSYLRGLKYADDEYKDLAADLESKVELAIKPSALKKKAEIIVKEDEIKKAVDDKFEEEDQKIEDAKKEIADGEDEIEDGKQKIIDAKDKIAEGKNDLQEGKDKLSDGKEKIDDAREQLADAKKQLADGRKKLDDGIAEYNDKYQEWLDGYNELEDGKKKYQDALEDYENGKCQYDGAMRDYHIAEDLVVDFEGMRRDISEGKVTYYNFDATLNEWQYETKLRELGEITSKYESGGEVLISSIPEINAQIAQLRMLPPEYFFPALIQFNDTQFKKFTDNSRQYLNEFSNRLKETEAELNKGLDELHDAEAEVNRGEAKLIYHKDELDDAQAKIDSKTKEYNDAERKYNDSVKELDDKQLEYDDAVDTIAEKEQEIKDHEQEIKDNEQKIEDGTNELVDLRQKLEDAIEEYNDKNVMVHSDIDRMDTVNVGNTYALTTRASNASLNSVQVMRDIIKKLRFTLAGLFVIVGLFVCYAAVTRMVYSQSTMIGVKKSLGYTDYEVKAFYILYTFEAVVLGCILGGFLGYGTEMALISAMSKNFPYDIYSFEVILRTKFIANFVQIALLVLITYMASRDLLSRNAIELLQGIDNRRGKTRFYEKWRLYDKLNFFYKMIINNCFTDRRRVLGTVVGIMSCTALIVTSITFNQDTLNSFKKHFGEYCDFNYIVYFDNSELDTGENLSNVVKQYTNDYALSGYEYALVQEPDGGRSLLNIYIPEDFEQFSRIYNVSPKENITGAKVSEGVWLDYAYRNYYKDDALSDLDLITTSGREIAVQVDGFMHYYLTTGMMIMSKDKYEQFYEKKLEPNNILIKMDESKADELREQLSGMDGFVKMSNYYESSKRTFNVLASLTYVIVAIYLILSVVMSVLVLLNLLNQFIDEKKKELIVMLINGFEYRDVKKYIYLDTIVLTGIGIVLGTILGTILGCDTMRTFDSPMVYFIRRPNLLACLCGIVGTSLLSYIMCVIALKRIDKFSLTDINKF